MRSWDDERPYQPRCEVCSGWLVEYDLERFRHVVHPKDGHEPVVAPGPSKAS